MGKACLIIQLVVDSSRGSDYEKVEKLCVLKKYEKNLKSKCAIRKIFTSHNKGSTSFIYKELLHIEKIISNRELGKGRKSVRE